MNKTKFKSFTASLVLATTFTLSCEDKEDKDKFTDSRDGKKYKTVTIGTQTWMAENLNYAAEGSLCYDSAESNCEKYGRLYVLDLAKTSCPAGWRLPSTDEWTTLIEAVGGRWERGHYYGIDSALKAAEGWKDGYNGYDRFGFSALPGGGGGLYGNGGVADFNGIGSNGEWWSSGDQYSSGEVLTMEENYVRWFQNDLASVRCLRNDASFTDSRDGKTYKKVTIGTQTWMAENLNYEAKGSKCYENNPDNCANYGRLYDWKTAKKSCPKGWHLPSRDEYEVLYNTVGGDAVSGKKLRARIGWNNYDKDTDDYGFSALPGGLFLNGNFHNVGNRSQWWSATGTNIGKAYSRRIDDDDIAPKWSDDYDKSSLMSVRCIQD